jgi:hypothetical protein
MIAFTRISLRVCKYCVVCRKSVVVLTFSLVVLKLLSANMLANLEFCLRCVVRDGGVKFDTYFVVGHINISFIGL